MEIRNSVVVVTGAGGEGSGRAIAQHFARNGARVVVSDILESGARETVRRVKAEGSQALAFKTDVRVEEEVGSLIAFTETAFGGLDLMVNNASAPYRPGEPLEHWVDTIQTDLLGALYGTRLAIDAMRRRGGGAIVNISSTSALGHGRRKPGGSPAYDVAKAGVLRLTTMLGWLYERERIRVNCLAPDWIATEEVCAYVDSLTPERREQERVPTTLTTLGEIADAVTRLATDDSLAGRVLVWWSDDCPRFIPWGDQGYSALESDDPGCQPS
jgi:NAD(P)-dependent dehydrogenase (short-subunit alcohol dehydrogenase family)